MKYRITQIKPFVEGKLPVEVEVESINRIIKGLQDILYAEYKELIFLNTWVDRDNKNKSYASFDKYLFSYEVIEENE